MQRLSNGRLLAIFLSFTLHAVALHWGGLFGFKPTDRADKPRPPGEIIFIKAVEAPVVETPHVSPPTTPPPPRVESPPAKLAQHSELSTVAADVTPPAASKDAPPAPTEQEWALASQYTLKNSKAYRHSWGQQVRSMMGTAVEGPDQGSVRFRIEIAPDGRLTRLETLWSTSAVAERLARQAIENMPRLPATPTGKPLIFERTINFSPFAHDDPPLYKNDCQPDPPEFKNPFAWDGRASRATIGPVPAPQPADPEAMADCLKQLPKDSAEAEEAQDRRILEQWASPKLGH